MKNTFLRSLFLAVLVIQSLSTLYAQNRISDNNAIGWFSVNGNFKLSQKWSITSDLHWRRIDIVKTGMADIIRNSINYQIAPEAQVRFGYAYIPNYPYGDHPINGFGKSFTEHRMFQAMLISDKIGRVDLIHRFMLEQRWIGRYSNANLEKADQYPFFNRLRYMARIQVPLGKNAIENKTPYFAVYDEIFIGFGKNIGENVFDQNRLGIMFGYRFTDLFRLEGGYLNHIFQLGREIENKNVFQYNQGIIINAFFSLDWSKK